MADDSALEKLLAAVEGLAARMDALEAGNNEDCPTEEKAKRVLNARSAAEQAREQARADSIPANIRRNKLLRDELDRRERALSLQMREAGPLSDRDRAQMSEIQSRHDAVQAHFGRQAPAPMPGESPRMYRVRLLHDLQKYSPDLKDGNFSREEMSTLDFVEKSLFDSAIAEARRPTMDLKDGELRKVVRKDESGRDIIEFFGKDTFIRQFSGPCWKATKLRTAEDIALERAINSVRH